MTASNDKFDYLISLATLDCGDEDVEILKSANSCPVAFDSSYYKKRVSSIRRYKRRTFVIALKLFALRASIVTVIAVFLAVVLVGCVPALNDTVYYSVTKWYDNYVIEKYGESSYGSYNPNSSDIDAAVPSLDHITEFLTPTYFPSDVREEIIIQNAVDNKINYYAGDTLALSFNQSVIDDSNVLIDSTVAIYYNVNIGELSGVAVEYNDGQAFLYWSDGTCMYELTSSVYSVGTLIRIAESVKA